MIQFKEFIGSIRVGNNVFIGANSTILGGVNIGSNVIIGACSLVNKDIPENSVWGEYQLSIYVRLKSLWKREKR